MGMPLRSECGRTKAGWKGVVAGGRHRTIELLVVRNAGGPGK